MRKRYKITIKLRTPMCIATGNSSGGLVDKVFLRDAENRPYIPGSTLKGAIRQYFMSLAGNEHKSSGRCSCPVCRVFGGGGYNPSRVYVDDMKLVGDAVSSARYGTAVDRYRRVVKDNSLFSVEVVEKGIFEGYLDFYEDDYTRDYEELLLVSLKMINSIGEGKSRGHGWIKLDVEEVKA